MLFGKKDEKEKFTGFDEVVDYMRKQKVSDFFILSQLISALTDVVNDIVDRQDYNTLIAMESHIDKILLSKVKNAIAELEKSSKNGRRK